MIFSIGYQGLASPDDLMRTLAHLGATLVDVRSNPHFMCKRGYKKRELEAALGDRYVWQPLLGGRGAGPKPEGLAWLVKLAAEGKPLALMCAEESPGECHRHHDIAVPMLARGIDVHHVYQDEVILASELQRSIDEDDDYDCTCLADYSAA